MRRTFAMSNQSFDSMDFQPSPWSAGAVYVRHFFSFNTQIRRVGSASAESGAGCYQSRCADQHFQHPDSARSIDALQRWLTPSARLLFDER